MADTNKVLKPKDVAEQLGITTRTLFRWDEEGSFKARRFPNGRKYYIQGDVDSLTKGEAFESSVPVLTVGGGDTGLPNFYMASVCEAGLEDFYRACEEHYDEVTIKKPSAFIDSMDIPLEVILHAEHYSVAVVKEAIHSVGRAWEDYNYLDYGKRTKGNCYGGV